MTTPQDVSPEKRFVPATLPWVVAAGSLLIYLFTLNTWVSFNSLGHVAKVSGWLGWQPEVNAPLFWLVTYPFHWLPARVIPIALNLFAAICAALTLALLARSVALLPHDRTEAQRIREINPFATLTIRANWLPPILACIVCGLQLTFWENATVASSDIFDLLLFAYVIRCLLEFRLDGRDSWLFRASLVYGAAIPNNWAMVAFLPVFIAALFWLKGLSFFHGGFLGRMSLLALLGLSLYLLLPLVNTFNHQLGFWPALKANLGAQRFYLLTYVFNKYLLFKYERPFWVLALPSLVPILLLSIRWPAYFGDTSKLGQGLTSFVLNATFAVFLGLCAWVSLDPEQFGPRYQMPPQQVPMLTLYYLGALSVGYFVGYFLLVFGSKPAGRLRRSSSFSPLVNSAVLGAVALLALVAPLLLVYRNLPQIRITNGPMLRQYAALLAGELTAPKTIALSDDPVRLLLLQSAFTQARRAEPPLLVASPWLPFPDYHRFLNKTAPTVWRIAPPPARNTQFGGVELALLMSELARTNALYYLHPSFGYYFEVFYPEPHGLVSRLLTCPTNSLLSPGLTREVVSKNEEFWAAIDDSILKPVLAAVAKPSALAQPGLLDRLARELRLGKEPNPTACLLGAYYSRVLDNWGVQLQRLDPSMLPQAGARFDEALALKPDNVVAQSNLECNRTLRAGQVPPYDRSVSPQDLFGKFRDWDEVMNLNGPFDHPTFCYAEGLKFAYPREPGGFPLLRQAAQQFRRVSELVTNDLYSRLRLAEVFVLGRTPDAAIGVLEDVHSHAGVFGLSSTNEPWVLGIEASAHLAKGDLEGAQNVIQTALRSRPDDYELLSAASQALMRSPYSSNALTFIDRQLNLQPNDPNPLYNKGLASFQLKSYDRAIESFSRVLQIETNLTADLHLYALFYRAQACAASDKFDDAKSDYEALLLAVPSAISIYKEIAEVASRKHDTKEAIHNFELYLAKLPTNNVAEIKSVRERLEQLKPGSR